MCLSSGFTKWSTHMLFLRCFSSHCHLFKDNFVNFVLVLSQAKWYYYILLGLVDVEANFLGKYLWWRQIELFAESIGWNLIYLYAVCLNNSRPKHNLNLTTKTICPEFKYSYLNFSSLIFLSCIGLFLCKKQEIWLSLGYLPDYRSF